MQSPVLVLAYNRPDLTARVLEGVALAEPSRVYFSIDGARDRADEIRVQKVKDLATNFRGSPEVFIRDSQTNQGCRRAVTAGIDWFFSQEEQGIVLEDDTIPHKDFFSFCDLLLDRFADDTRVWGIGGSNMVGKAPNNRGEFGFIRLAQIWGWATWANRWRYNDALLRRWRDRIRRGGFSWQESFHGEIFARKLNSILATGRPDTWDYQWAWSVLENDGLWVYPRENLIENIGFRSDASHATTPPSWLQKLSSSPSVTIKNFDVPVVADVKAEWLIARRVHGVFKPLWLFALVKTLSQHRRLRWLKTLVQRISPGS